MMRKKTRMSDDFVEEFKPESRPVASIGRVVPEALAKLRYRAAHALLKRIADQDIRLSVISGMFVAKGISQSDKELLIMLRDEVLRILGVYDVDELEQSIQKLIATKAWTKEIEDAYRQNQPGRLGQHGCPGNYRPEPGQNGKPAG
jgi:hypothetical protein